jgi:hypothetical protein
MVAMVVSAGASAPEIAEILCEQPVSIITAAANNTAAEKFFKKIIPCSCITSYILV